ncbi:hypothetical protein N0V82_000215 [Gnomoniopsis sp. IMI 355080]|nr:hypothetical protein N0V82_000215 [Gnomoniopsis sp. IMI 355080]
MSGARIAVDGLWRCLCPSFDAVALVTTIPVPHRLRRLDSHPAATTTCGAPRAAPRRRRQYHTSARRLPDDKREQSSETSAVQADAEVTANEDLVPKSTDLGDRRTFVKIDRESSNAWKEYFDVVLADDTEARQERDSRIINELVEGPLPETVDAEAQKKDPSKEPSGEVERKQRSLPNIFHDGGKVNIGEILEESAGKDPFDILGDGKNEQQYKISKENDLGQGSSPIAAATCAERVSSDRLSDPGSTVSIPANGDGKSAQSEDGGDKNPPRESRNMEMVERLLQMKPPFKDVPPEASRQDILMALGHRFIVLGLLRDEQYEMALDKLETMIQEGIEVDPWVFDIFIYVFGKLEFLDDALRLVRHRLDRGFDVSLNIWYFLLDVCSKGQNHQATTYIWNRTVKQGVVNPSDGVALNILNMASVYGDTELATQVIQYLAERGTKLSRAHYEALADAYSMQGNVERAIEVYCIMHGAGAEVSQASVGTLCQSLSRDPSHINQAVDAMEQLKKKYKLPVGVFNAVLNEMVKSSASTPEKAFIRALELYRRIREFVPNGPNLETFRNLLWRCTRSEIAQFLAAEMVAFKIRQNLVIMELMFKVHVEHNGPVHRVKAAFYKVAPHFHSDYAPGSRRWQNIMDLSVKLVKRLIAERDPEAWRILDICRRNGLEEDTIRMMREDVEAGRLAATDAPALPNVQAEDPLGLRQF